MSDYVYTSKEFEDFKSTTLFINAEWGVKIDLFPSEDQFRALIEANAQKMQKGALIQFRDIMTLTRKKLGLS